MQATEVLIQILDMNRDMVNRALDGLTDEELAKRPTDQCNSIGWLVWHLARAEDALVSAGQKSPELWVEQGWHQKFGMDPEGSGYKHTAEDLAAFKVPSADLLKGYWAATEEKTRDYLRSLSPEDLDRQVPSLAGDGTMPLASLFNYAVNEALVHGGQIAYLRGMHHGMGWHY